MARVRQEPTRYGYTHKVKIFSHPKPVSLYITGNTYQDGRPSEIFCKVQKQEWVWLDQWAMAISMLLQRGCTVDELVRNFAWSKFEPAGLTDNPAIHRADSLTDYVIRWLELTFKKPETT